MCTWKLLLLFPKMRFCSLGSLLLLVSMLTGVRGTRIRLYNACPFVVWPAWIPKPGHPQLGDGGVRLDPWQLFDIHTSPRWSGIIWGRTNCIFDTVLGTGCCETGDCDGKVACNTTFSPPAAYVEFNLHQEKSDEYSVSLVEGYNLEIRVTSSDRRCVPAGCTCDLNSRCPSELLFWSSQGRVVACSSPCLAFGSDVFCCRGEFAGPDKCHPNQFSSFFKECCPASKTYLFDDVNASLRCTGGSEFTITFCPTAVAVY